MARQVDWAAEERKLQSVYDDIQQGRLKPASVAVTRWLKKNPKSQPALALRMFLLSKQSAGAPAVLEAYMSVKRTGPLTGRTVWFAGIALRSIRRNDLVVELYQELWDARPDSLELGDQVFLAAAAAGNADVMSTASRKLFNATKAPQWARLAAYSSWSSLAPPPTDADPFSIAPDKSLLPAALLLKMTGSLVASADQLWLRLQVALGSGDNAGAWALVRTEGRKGALARRWAGMQAAKVCAARGVPGVWEEELDATLETLASDPEVVHNYALYLHVLAALDGSYSEARAAKAAKAFSDLDSTIGEKERAPALAMFELDSAERQRGRGMPESEWEERLKVYLSRWGSIGSTVDELARIGGDDRIEQVRRVVTDQRKPHSDGRSFRALSVTELFLLRHGAPSASPAGIDDAKRYWTLYTEGLVYEANVPKTDVLSADEMGLAAVEVLLRAWEMTPTDDSLLLTTAACLEYILSKSPSSFKARFTLTRVYRLLGAPSLYLPHLSKLDLAEIQLDNLLHVVSERGGMEAHLAASELSEAWITVTGKAEAMYSRSATDLPEFIKQALEHESYSKIHGMRTLIRCLDRSISQRVLELESLLLALATGEEVSEDVLESSTAALQSEAPFVDNRNFELMVDTLAKSSAPQPTLSEAAVRALGAVAVRTTRFMRGEPIPELAMNTDQLSEVDKAYVEAMSGVLRRASDLESEGLSTGLYDTLITLSRTGTTWSRNNAMLMLAQLAKTADAVARQVTETTKPSKGKKRSAGATALIADLKSARDSLNRSLASSDANIVSVTAEARESARTFVTDDLLVETLCKQVEDAQRGLRSGITQLLDVKST